ncbi:hypothetical protein Lal_00000795 [Lupinus albus]|nr:hypothetical protein Lal_00000795 [Lupinus albus]
MEEYSKSSSYGNYLYHGSPMPHDLRSYSLSHAQSQMGSKDMKLKKRKNMFKCWSIADPEFQRKKRIANYKLYSVEDKVKGSFMKSFTWLKAKYTEMVYDW